MSSFVDDLKAEFEAERPYRDVPVKLNGTLHTLRFTQMSGADWTSAGDQTVARPNVLIDVRYGYNIRALTYIAAPKSGKLLESGTLTDLTDDQWRNLLKTIPGPSFNAIADALYVLNEYEPAEAVEALKKASTGAGEPSTD